MLATPAKTTPMLATNNYYQARPDFVEAKKKPAPNAEAPEAGHGPKAAEVKTKCHPVYHREGRKFHSPSKQTANPQSEP